MLKKDKKGMTLSMLGKLVIGAILLWVLLALIIGPQALLNIAAKGAEWFADNALFGLIKAGQKPVLESDKSIEETYENILSILRTEGSGPCVFKYKPFSERLSDFNIKLSNTEQGIYVEFENKKNQQIIKSNTVAGKVACVVGEGQAARNFYNNYLDGTPCEDNCPKDYSIANIVITNEAFDTKGTIYVNGKERDFNDRYLIFKTREEGNGKGGNVCFFPTISFNKLPGCDAAEEGLDDDCMERIEKSMKSCGDVEYKKIIKELFFENTYYGRYDEWQYSSFSVRPNLNVYVGPKYYYRGNDERIPYIFKIEARDKINEKRWFINIIPGLSSEKFNKVFSSGTQKTPDKPGTYFEKIYYGKKEEWKFATESKKWIYMGNDNDVPAKFKTEGVSEEQKVIVFGPPFEETGG